jgi:uncharacterized SAM-binding protein YcdF (DUF218 family)
MRALQKSAKIFFLVLGSVFFVLIFLAFTTLPFHGWYRMSMARAGVHRPPDYIVILGGGGMPSETGLMRTWFGARAANYFSRSKVIIALPGNGADEKSSLRRMQQELVLRGISPDRILLEDSGTNTRSQALCILNRISNIEQRSLILDRTYKFDRNSMIVAQYSIFNSILVVTSPEHLYRAVCTFKKAGFARVDGLPAFETAIESNLLFNAKALGGKRWFPDIGSNLTLRYEFWTQLRYEQLLLREYLGILYYKLMGWM